jgi:hypothetical protein
MKLTAQKVQENEVKLIFMNVMQTDVPSRWETEDTSMNGFTIIQTLFNIH